MALSYSSFSKFWRLDCWLCLGDCSRSLL